MQAFYIPYESTEELIEKGLIIDLTKNGEPKNFETTSDELEEIAVNLNVEEITEEVESVEPIKEQLRENEVVIDGVNYVFKPYFSGYKDCDVVVIPMRKDAFYKLKESKQTAVLNTALKKHQKKMKKAK